MTRATAALGLLACAACHRAPDHGVAATSTSPAALSNAAPQRDLLYGRITTNDDVSYEGRLRWGGDQEALWGNYFNGFKDENPWVADVPSGHLPADRHSFQVFGLDLGGWDVPRNFGRPFMTRFGDIALIEPKGRDIRVTLKSGTAFDLDWNSVNDLSDGVRVWDSAAGVVDLEKSKIRTLEFFSIAEMGAGMGTGAHALYGTVRTRQGDFTGLIQWDREQCVGSDEIHGHTAGSDVSLRFDTIRSMVRPSRDEARVTLVDGREVVLSGAIVVGDNNLTRGIYVDDARYGRVLISWNTFERVDFSPLRNGPAYGDFPPGRPLAGSVIARSGRRLAGRLVFDLDESETTETLDASAQGVGYTIPFGLVASIVLAAPEDRGTQLATVTLQSGEKLQLEHTGDLGGENAGILIFADERQRPEYVSWNDVEQVNVDRPPEMYPPNGR